MLNREIKEASWRQDDNRSQSRKRSEEYRAANKRRRSSIELQRLSHRHGLSRWDEPVGSGFDAVLAKDFEATEMDVAVQDLAQARIRQDRLRALRLILILAVIEGAEPKQMRYL